MTLSSSQQASTEKGKNEREFEGMQLDQKKKIIYVFLLFTESMPRIMHPDVWTRVKAENVSIRHV